MKPENNNRKKNGNITNTWRLNNMLLKKRGGLKKSKGKSENTSRQMKREQLSIIYGILLLLSHFSRVRLCATPGTAAHQAPPSLGFSRQEHWSGLPFPSPVHESGK